MIEGKIEASRNASAAETPTIGFRPLYQQVKAVLLRRIADGFWVPGEALPSENQIANEIGVSQGTVRKALDELAAENLVVRRQGRGTFVAEHDEPRILFQFFKLVPDGGERRFPDSTILDVSKEEATPGECEALRLDAGTRVVRIRRLRALGEKPVILETLSLPEATFPGLADGPVPNNLYRLFASRYGVTIGRAQEKLKAVILSVQEAETLGVAAGTPALRIDRVALSLDGAPVELRLSLCLTDRTHYQSDLR